MSVPEPFDKHMAAIADSMGIGLYQRFDVREASLFLRCSQDDVTALIQKHRISYIQITARTVGFFGYQLLEYTLAQVQGAQKAAESKPERPVSQSSIASSSERIIRFKEVQAMVGVSRTTIWRWEMSGKFPMRVSLGAGSVGWMKSDVDAWIRSKSNS
ncbi:MAG: AlpA family phage regulatory protein [Pseudomonadota bacterium]